MTGYGAIVDIGQSAIDFMVRWPGIGLMILAVVFLFSGQAKLRNPIPAAMAMIDFGVTRQLHPTFGWLLGLTEIVLTSALLVGAVWLSIGRLAATSAAVLLSVFLILIVRSLVKGERFNCACFGMTDDDLSVRTLGRTAALAAIASGMAVSMQVRPPKAIGGTSFLLEFACAIAVLGGITLCASLPNLLRWNQDPLGMRRVVQS